MERVEQLEKQVKKQQEQIEKLQKRLNDVTETSSSLPKIISQLEEQIYYNSSHMPGWEDS